MKHPARRHHPSSLRSFLGAPLLLGLTLAACSGGQDKSPSGTTAAERSAGATAESLADAPPWVTGDCRDAFEGKAAICGVGSVSGVASPSLARNTAMARGRTEIARYLSVEVRSVLRDYQGAKNGTTEQEIEERSTQISEMTLNGSRMVSYFVGADGTYYALMALELAAFSESIRSAANIDEPLKDSLIDHATKAFSSRDSETSRY